MAIYVVTGGAGFIGSNIAEGLLARGETVRIVDDFSTGNRANIEAIKNAADVHEVDIAAGAGPLKEIFDGADFVIHQAAIPSVPRSVDDPLACHRANVTGTVNVLVAAKEVGVKRVVYAASSSAYGDTPTLPKREDMLPRPLSPYAAAKLAGEYYCRVFSGVYGLETASLRYFNVFGPRQDPRSKYAAVIPIFITAMLKNTPPRVYGDGTQTRDFTFVENVVEANLLACSADLKGNRVFNIGGGSRITINQLVEDLNGLLETQIAASYVPERPGDVKHSLADISLARDVLGYEGRVTFREGLERTLAWYRRVV